MTDLRDRIDHAAEARLALEGSGDGRNFATDASVNAVAHAVLALVEQTRIANLISLAEANHPVMNEQVARDALTTLATHKEHGMGGWWELRPEITAALGITTGDDDE